MTSDSTPKLDSHHRATVEKLFGHPTSNNVQWHDVLSLLESLGTVREHEDRITVTIGSETEGFERPKGHHDLTEQQVVDLRHMLSGVGITAESTSDD